ncbi:MAG: hypothetical protein Q9218_006427, partial [Villophora microphyllina]
MAATANEVIRPTGQRLASDYQDVPRAVLNRDQYPCTLPPTSRATHDLAYYQSILNHQHNFTAQTTCDIFEVGLDGMGKAITRLHDDGLQDYIKVSLQQGHAKKLLQAFQVSAHFVSLLLGEPDYGAPGLHHSLDSQGKLQRQATYIVVSGEEDRCIDIAKKRIEDAFSQPTVDQIATSTVLDPFLVHHIIAHESFLQSKQIITKLRHRLYDALDNVDAYGKGDKSLDRVALRALTNELHLISQDADSLVSSTEMGTMVVERMSAAHKRLRKESDAALQNGFSLVEDSLEQLVQTLHARRRWLLSYKSRKDIAMNLVFNLVTQQDSETNMSIAQATKNDRAAMKTIAALTMVFLPATAVSSFFGMAFFNGQGGSLTVTSNWWIFLITTVPITLMLFLIWLKWTAILGALEVVGRLTLAGLIRGIASRSRRTRSATSSRASSLDGSEFSMEDYSIDLAKIGEKDSSWTLGKAAGERDIERLSSRDEGPEDFTLRLGEWMRGTMPWKKDSTSKEQGPHEDEKDLGKGRKPLADAEVSEYQDDGGIEQTAPYDADQSEFLPLGTSTPAVGFLQQAHRRPSAPSRLNTEAMQDLAAQEVFDQISALQAEVERLRLENMDHLSAKRSIEHSNLQQQKECRTLRTQVDDLKSEAKRLQDSEFKASQKALRLEQELKRDVSKVGSLRARFEPLSQELDTVKSKAEADKQYADSTINALKADLKAAKDYAAKSQADLTMAMSTHAADVEGVKAESEALKTKFQHREDILKEQLQAKDHAIDTLKEGNAKIAAESKPAAAASPELEQAREQLTEARRMVQNVEDENELLVQESERQAKEITNLQQALEEERLRHLSSTDAQVADLQDEIARMQAQKTADTISYAEHRAGLDELRQEHTAATEDLSTKHKQEMKILRAAIIKAGEGMKKREGRIVASQKKETIYFKDRIASLEAELESSKVKKLSHSDTENEPTTNINKLSGNINALKYRLNTAPADIAEAYAEAERCRQESYRMQQEVDKAKAYVELVREEATKHCQTVVAKANERVKAVIQENEQVNEEMDRRMEEREREWRRRIKVVFKDRDVVAKALMASWGRE